MVQKLLSNIISRNMAPYVISLRIADMRVSHVVKRKLHDISQCDTGKLVIDKCEYLLQSQQNPSILLGRY